MAAILEVSGLKKTYKNFELKNVSFSIHEDCITGFIGVNGGFGICIWFISFALSKRIFNKKDLI